MKYNSKLYLILTGFLMIFLLSACDPEYIYPECPTIQKIHKIPRAYLEVRTDGSITPETSPVAFDTITALRKSEQYYLNSIDNLDDALKAAKNTKEDNKEDNKEE